MADANSEEDEVVSERKLVEDYLKTNDLEDVLNNVVNELVMERPADPFLSLSNVLVDFSKSSRKIVKLTAREVVGVAGMYLQVEVETTKGVFSSLLGGYGYDDDPGKHNGRGYTKVINSINALLVPKLQGQDPTEQAAIDEMLAEEAGLSDIARTAVSIAVCKAGAKQSGQEVYAYVAELANVYNACLPVPVLTLVEGGKSATNKLPVQGVVVFPYGVSSVQDAVELTGCIQRRLEAGQRSKNDVIFGKNGGVAPAVSSMEEALTLVRDAIKAEGAVNKVAYGLDVSAPDFAEVVRRASGGEGDAVYNLSTWDVEAVPPLLKKKEELVDMYTDLLVNHAIISLSEPLHPLHRAMVGRLSENVKQFIQGAKGDMVDLFKQHFDGIGGDRDCLMQLVGDQTLKTEADLEDASTKKTLNALQLSLRKGGTVSRFIKLAQKAQALGMGVVVSTDREDQSDAYEDFVTHAAVGVRAGQLCLGPLRHAEALSKVHELTRIERVGSVPYAGAAFRSFH